MQAAPRPSRVVKFGLFEVNLEDAELRKSGMRQKLVGQPFEVLRVLLEHPQELVTREELQRRIWPKDTFVDYDLALKKAVIIANPQIQQRTPVQFAEWGSDQWRQSSNQWPSHRCPSQLGSRTELHRCRYALDFVSV